MRVLELRLDVADLDGRNRDVRVDGHKSAASAERHKRMRRAEFEGSWTFALFEKKKVFFNQKIGLFVFILNDRIKYIDFGSQSTKSDNNTNFNSLYIGGNYTFDSLLIDEFQQSIIFQTAVLQNIKYQNGNWK